MFTTFVKVCSLIVAVECTEFKDDRGPYATKEECEARAYEIAKDLMTVFKTPVEFSYKCNSEMKGHAT